MIYKFWFLFFQWSHWYAFYFSHKFVTLLIKFTLFRMTLLLGPPGSGKTTLLKAIAGKLDADLRVCNLPFRAVNKLQVMFWLVKLDCQKLNKLKQA